MEDKYCGNCRDLIENNNKPYYEDSEFCRECEDNEMWGMWYE